MLQPRKTPFPGDVTSLKSGCLFQDICIVHSMAEFPGGWGIFIILWRYIPLFNAKITKSVKTNFGVFFASQLLKVFNIKLFNIESTVKFSKKCLSRFGLTLQKNSKSYKNASYNSRVTNVTEREEAMFLIERIWLNQEQRLSWKFLRLRRNFM